MKGKGKKYVKTHPSIIFAIFLGFVLSLSIQLHLSCFHALFLLCLIIIPFLQLQHAKFLHFNICEMAKNLTIIFFLKNRQNLFEGHVEQPVICPIRV